MDTRVHILRMPTPAGRTTVFWSSDTTRPSPPPFLPRLTNLYAPLALASPLLEHIAAARLLRARYAAHAGCVYVCPPNTYAEDARGEVTAGRRISRRGQDAPKRKGAWNAHAVVIAAGARMGRAVEGRRATGAHTRRTATTACAYRDGISGGDGNKQAGTILLCALSEAGVVVAGGVPRSSLSFAFLYPDVVSLFLFLIATLHTARRHRVLAAQTLRALGKEAEKRRREVNEWCSRAHIATLEPPPPLPRSKAHATVLSGELEDFDVELDFGLDSMALHVLLFPALAPATAALPCAHPRPPVLLSLLPTAAPNLVPKIPFGEVPPPEDAPDLCTYLLAQVDIQCALAGAKISTLLVFDAARLHLALSASRILFDMLDGSRFPPRTTTSSAKFPSSPSKHPHSTLIPTLKPPATRLASDSATPRRCGCGWKTGLGRADMEATPFEVRDVCIEIPRETPAALVGRVGSDKSSLLQGLVGEMFLIKGRFSCGGRIAYGAAGLPPAPPLKSTLYFTS
ncbi:hypothetical protein B0H11DRAFT_2251297 [Mycena galericulata]|nr:hypothetical protein B0H11DRAFT_2251297 [Mycena galericulata]